MVADADIYYRALTARDARFDGVFFTGVTTTGIYCRPVCTAKTPGRDRCRFFANAALAESAGFRPCLRCRPELAPGNTPLEAVRSVARVAAARIEAGALNDGGTLDELAGALGLSTRQLRRAVRQELGVSPVELAQTNRLLLAKRLIAETNLPMINVAFGAGFQSVRRFNHLFQARYRLTPRAMRRGAAQLSNADVVRLTLAYRPPLDWSAMLRFLAARATPGVECVAEGAYLRTLAIGRHRGWLRVTPIRQRDQLAVELATTLVPALPAVLALVRGAFDLDARPEVIASHLRRDARLARLVRRRPGLRVPGAIDGFELALRAILGQQVSVKAATTLAGRVAEAFGEATIAPQGCLNRLAPTAERLADVRPAAIASLGVLPPRAVCIVALARKVAGGELDLSFGTNVLETIEHLQVLPGVGEWTAQYIAMRALRWPDALPAGDLGLLAACQLKSPAKLRASAESWRPWRAYAAMHLWQSLADSSGNGVSHGR